MQRSLKGELWVYALCAPKSATDKMEGGMLMIFLGLGLSIDPPISFFLPTPLLRSNVKYWNKDM